MFVSSPARKGVNCIVSLTPPYRSVRYTGRQFPKFVKDYCKCSLEERMR